MSAAVAIAARALANVEARDADIVATDIEVSNGIIHVIDRVILPEM